MIEPLKIICAWCGRLVRDGKLPISHGMCRGCADSMLEQLLRDEAQEKKEGTWQPRMH